MLINITRIKHIIFMIRLKNYLCSYHLWFCCKYYHSEKHVILAKHLLSMICLWIIHVTQRIWIFYGQEYVLIYIKSTKSTKSLTCLKSVRSVI